MKLSPTPRPSMLQANARTRTSAGMAVNCIRMASLAIDDAPLRERLMELYLRLAKSRGFPSVVSRKELY